MLFFQDRTDAVASHILKGIEFLDRVGVFAAEKAQIEEEYAKKLRFLLFVYVKKYGFRNLIKKCRKKEDEDSVKTFSSVRAFTNVLKEVESVAGQHEVRFSLFFKSFV